ncbi:MAG: hypothetical protein RJQ04_12385 [Longimicrobiales bacterium]
MSPRLEASTRVSMDRLPSWIVRSLRHVLAVGSVGVLAFPSLLAAQTGSGSAREAVRSLEDSARVRVIAPGVYVDPGLFLGVVGDSLHLSDADVRLAVAFDELEELAVQGSKWRKVGLTSAGVAAVFGIAIGYFVGTSDCEFQLSGCGGHQLRGSLRWGGALALVGGVAGATIGSRQTSWRRVFP